MHGSRGDVNATGAMTANMRKLTRKSFKADYWMSLKRYYAIQGRVSQSRPTCSFANKGQGVHKKKPLSTPVARFPLGRNYISSLRRDLRHEAISTRAKPGRGGLEREAAKVGRNDRRILCNLFFEHGVGSIDSNVPCLTIEYWPRNL